MDKRRLNRNRCTQYVGRYPPFHSHRSSFAYRKAGSLLVIEEVDNGLHPSRSHELVKVLKTLGRLSQIDIVCTTHNPVLIDTLGNEMIPFISYVTRSEESGYSVVSLLEEKHNLAKLMAHGSVGDLMTEDAL